MKWLIFINNHHAESRESMTSKDQQYKGFAPLFPLKSHHMLKEGFLNAFCYMSRDVRKPDFAYAKTN